MVGWVVFPRPGGRGGPTCHRGGTAVVCLVVGLIHAHQGVEGLHAIVAEPRWYVRLLCKPRPGGRGRPTCRRGGTAAVGLVVR